MTIENDQYKGIGPLFDICSNKHGGNPMSVQANKITHKGKASARERILETLRASNGKRLCIYWTCEELEEFIHLPHQTCSARLSELRREGKIKIVGERKTKSGALAAVYQASPHI